MSGLRFLHACCAIFLSTIGAAGSLRAESSPQAERTAIPDIDVQDQAGHTQHFYSDLIKGNIVAVNFVFTGCSSICPRLGASSAALARELAKHGDPRYRVISISIDPANDTPEALREWSAHFGVAPGWTLLTGKPRDIENLLRALQVYAADKDLHSGNFLLGNAATDSWRRVDGTTVPTRLAEALQELARTPNEMAHVVASGE